MSERDNGGPAFPYTNIPDEFDPVVQKSGMSLRDYFAAKAMQGALAHGNPDALPVLTLAHDSYRVADAMLQAREAK